jgi:hypothetical protein
VCDSVAHISASKREPSCVAVGERSRFRWRARFFAASEAVDVFALRAGNDCSLHPKRVGVASLEEHSQVFNCES